MAAAGTVLTVLEETSEVVVLVSFSVTGRVLEVAIGVLEVSGMAGWMVVVMSRVAEKVFIASGITGRVLVGSGIAGRVLIASGEVEMMLVVSGVAARVLVVSGVAERVLVA